MLRRWCLLCAPSGPRRTTESCSRSPRRPCPQGRAPAATSAPPAQAPGTRCRLRRWETGFRRIGRDRTRAPTRAGREASSECHRARTLHALLPAPAPPAACRIRARAFGTVVCLFDRLHRQLMAPLSALRRDGSRQTPERGRRARTAAGLSLKRQEHSLMPVGCEFCPAHHSRLLLPALLWLFVRAAATAAPTTSQRTMKAAAPAAPRASPPSGERAALTAARINHHWSSPPAFQDGEGDPCARS